MFAYALAALFLVLFGIGVLRDRRRFSNAVYLGLAVVFLTLALLVLVDDTTGPAHPVLKWATVALLLVPVVGACALPFLLLSNGVKMIRREGRSPANLLSFLAGLGILGLVALLITAVASGSRTLAIAGVTLTLIVGYVSFLFFCFIAYAFLYGRLQPRKDLDYVVVLGCGLTGGDRVPPLLASRLERGRRIYESQRDRGKRPLLLVSGGKGSDEKLPESHAMAAYLTAKGVPAGDILLEDRSRTTEENLRYSAELMSAGPSPDYRCVIVTNNFHAFRAALTARATGVDGQVVGSPTAAYFWPSATLREFAAIFLAHRRVNLTVVGVLAALGIGAWLLS
ncbi:YdcF family protein [Streptomyces sp. NBC_00083]|uniref:YdcF family protein n=1 Tax=Streptomyces sp. NBC_00083 TaxID=2975647 RepID=UPI00225ABE26|nr:ElyC/SanA/YdcF family protein [Streptomyces sp. NBC_00083]MCX5385296.1 YdcF family protein [Streptomyces sp. NBC_00083]